MSASTPAPVQHPKSCVAAFEMLSGMIQTDGAALQQRLDVIVSIARCGALGGSGDGSPAVLGMYVECWTSAMFRKSPRMRVDTDTEFWWQSIAEMVAQADACTGRALDRVLCEYRDDVEKLLWLVYLEAWT